MTIRVAEISGLVRLMFSPGVGVRSWEIGWVDEFPTLIS
jgi:hypothetical protein